MNKEVFDAEVYTIYRAHSILDRRQESGHRYTLFVDSTAAINRIRSDHTGPGQRFAIAEVCDQILGRQRDRYPVGPRTP